MRCQRSQIVVSAQGKEKNLKFRLMDPGYILMVKLH